jgi:hypothetical protein
MEGTSARVLKFSVMQSLLSAGTSALRVQHVPFVFASLSRRLHPFLFLPTLLLGAEGYHRAPLSYSTTRDPDPPKYARPAAETDQDWLKNAAWLDIGLDYRFRYEYRDDDLRRPPLAPPAERLLPT